MQFCIELPDELESELLQQADVKKLIANAIQKIVLEKQAMSQAAFPFDKLEALRERQQESKTTTLEHLQALKNEVRY